MRRFLAVAVVLLLGFAVVACGDDDDDAAPPAAQPTATSASAEPSGAPPPVMGEETVTDTGLRIIDEQVGDGEEAVTGKVIRVHYTGYLSDGTKFDSSRDRNQPFTFNLGAGDVIRGWDEGVQGMKVGGKRRLIIPPELGYGVGGAPPRIPSNAELTFDVELLEVQ